MAATEAEGLGAALLKKAADAGLPDGALSKMATAINNLRYKRLKGSPEPSSMELAEAALAALRTVS